MTQSPNDPTTHQPIEEIYRKMNRRHFLTGTVGLFGSAVLVGCGGGSSPLGGGRGRATITIKWPERSRFIPEMANSIVVQILDGLEVLDSVTLARNGGSMTTSGTFSDLPVQTLDLYIQAYPNSDGTGIAQAAAIEPITITSGETASVTATMFTLIASIEVTAAGNAARVGVGGTLQLTATPKDHDGNIVLTPTLLWSSSDTSRATVSSAGLVTAVTAESFMIIAEDIESQISTAITLNS